MLQVSTATTVDERIDVIVKHLAARAQARPRKVNTLGNTINSIFRKTLTDEEVSGLISELSDRDLVVIEEQNIRYRPPISQGG